MEAPFTTSNGPCFLGHNIMFIMHCDDTRLSLVRVWLIDMDAFYIYTSINNNNNSVIDFLEV